MRDTWKRTTRLHFRVALVALIFLALQRIPTVSAASYTWTGAGGDNNWSTCANWGGTCPTAEDSVTFNGTSAKNAIVDTSFTGTLDTLNISAGYTGTISLARSLTIVSTMAQAAGTFTADDHDVTVTSTFTLSGGVFNAPSTTFYALGNFAHTGGTFNHNSGTVNLNGNNQTISGSTTFYNLSKSHNTFVLTLTAGTTQTVVHNLILSGKTPLTRLYLRSSSDNLVWNIDAQGASRTISNIDVKDGANLNGSPIVTDTGSKDAGHNSGWVFPGYQLPQKVIDMANSNNWNIRFDGADTNSLVALGSIQTADIYRTGHQDIIVSAPCSSVSGLTKSGSVYIIAYSLYSQITGKGNVVDLANPNSYTLRIDGPIADPTCYNSNGLSGFGSLKTGDINGDATADLLLTLPDASYNGRSKSGSVYVLTNELLRNKTINQTGNIISLGHQDGESEFDNFNIRIDGPAPKSPAQGVDVNGYVTLGLYVGIGNITANGPDLVMSARATGFNDYFAGSVYVIGGGLIKSWSGVGRTIDLNTSTNYTLRIDGAHAFAAVTGYYMGDTVGDLDNDGKDDIVVGIGNLVDELRYPDYIGGAYILYNKHIAAKLGGTGATLDLGDASKPYSLLLKTGISWDGLGFQGPYTITDLNNDGQKWIVVGGAMFNGTNDRTRNGSVYVIPYSILNKYTGTGNDVDLTNGSNYYLRIDGVDNQHWLSDMFTTVQDYFGLGKKDILTGGPKQPSESEGTAGPSDWGWIFVISNSIINHQPQASGNIIDLANSANYSVLYQGAPTSANATTGTHVIAPMTDSPVDIDLNGDGTHDMLFAAHMAGFTNGTKSGSLYVIYNFPHEINISRQIRISDSSTRVSGTVAVGSGTTTVTKVQYNIDKNSPTASGWRDCQGTTSYTCLITGLKPGRHTIYLRAKDSNGVYTVQSSYASTSLNILPNESSSITLTNEETSQGTPIITTDIPSITPTITVIPSSTTSPSSSPVALNNNKIVGSPLCWGTLTFIIVLLIIFILIRKKHNEEKV